jgi:AbrB family looped-hinge helix DNA binding protein
MIQYALTKLSSKGQVVIPSELRKEFKTGEQLLIIKKDNQLIFRRMKDIDKKFEEELKFAKKTEEALVHYKKGEFKEKIAKEFLDELETW